nr:AraC family transcriptional regulator [Acidiferrobacterales bacterium]
MKNINDARVNPQKLLFIQKALAELKLPPECYIDSLVGNTDSEEKIKGIQLQDVSALYAGLSKLNVPGLAHAIGKKISCGDYGLYGCTLLCKNNLGDALNFSIKYHSLVTRTAKFQLTPISETASMFRCSDILFHPDAIDFNLELQIAINLTLIREVTGNQELAPVAIHYSFKRPAHFKLLEEYAGCKVHFGSDITGIEIQNSSLLLPLCKSNPLALPLLLKICEEHKLDYIHQNETVEHVYNWVSQNIHNELKLEILLAELCISERTLRRKLAEYDTSFSAICSTIKQGFAKKYIRDTQLSLDDIAESLGFKETSNFRHAFKTWTGLTPTQ